MRCAAPSNATNIRTVQFTDPSLPVPYGDLPVLPVLCTLTPYPSRHLALPVSTSCSSVTCRMLTLDLTLVPLAGPRPPIPISLTSSLRVESPSRSTSSPPTFSETHIHTDTWCSYPPPLEHVSSEAVALPSLFLPPHFSSKHQYCRLSSFPGDRNIPSLCRALATILRSTASTPPPKSSLLNTSRPSEARPKEA